MARLYGHSRELAQARAERVLEFVGLDDTMHKELGKYSKGMRQRAKIAQALVNDPDLIVLDEPLQGCDPLARTTVMNVIPRPRRPGGTSLYFSFSRIPASAMIERAQPIPDPTPNTSLSPKP